jgi:hypothetical protein
MSFHRTASLALLVLIPSAGEALAQENGSIAVRQTVQCCYREGSVSYVGITQVGNDLIATKTVRPLAGLEPILLVETELAPGTYVVSSYQRPCDGNCDVLNSPIDRCDSEPIEVEEGTAVSVLVSVVPFGGCTISVDPAGE